MPELLQRIGRNIKALRVKTGFSQEELAKLLSLDKAYISRVESGKKNLTLNSLGRIAFALKVDIQKLFK
jgi:transcriptional regulator with XRE-family HTH domain